ncbi:MAG: antitoxin Xre/MbcA/ParS toxin-binding domain-containing protein [Cyanobacteria bacterium P01_G01_bin.39]
MNDNAESTAKILGGYELLGSDIFNERDLEKRINQGLPFGSVNRLKITIDPENIDKDFIHRIIPKSSLQRRKKSAILSVEESQRIERLARVFSFAVEVWDGDEDKARIFMQKPHPMLDDRSPLGACLTELGARQAESILGRLYYGICA